MESYREETEWFHVYANAPGVHGRLMVTVESAELGKQYLQEMYEIPLASWQAVYVSEDLSQVDIWVSRESESRHLEGEDPETHFTIERVRVLRAGLSPNQVAGLKLGKPESPGLL
jgi:hypothetical protein